jgi:hypothetical protein
MEVDSLLGVQALEPGEDRSLGRGVNGGRLVAADTVPHDGLALLTGRHPLEDPAQVLDGAAAELEPGRHGSRG